MKKMKKLLSTALTLLFICCSLSALGALSNKASASGGVTYDNTLWKTKGGDYLQPDDDGEVTLTDTDLGMYYDGNIADKLYYQKTGTLRLTIEFSLNYTGPVPTSKPYSASAQFAIHIKPKPIRNWEEAIGGPEPEDKELIGVLLYWQPGYFEQDKILARGHEMGNFSTRFQDHISNFNPTDGATHTAVFYIDSKGVTMSVDGTVLGKGQSFRKWGMDNWTIADFLDENGEPQLYAVSRFNFPSFGEATVKNVYSDYREGEAPVEMGGFSGKEDSLYQSDGSVFLKNGEAYYTEAFSADNVIRGAFEVTEVPYYAYGGEAGSEATDKTWLKVTVNDANTVQAGYGFKITFRPLRSSGDKQTEIEIGWTTTLRKFEVATPIIGSHYFAVIPGDGWFNIVVDGESVFFDLKSTNEARDWYEALNKESMFVIYSTDGDAGETGDWIIKLSEPKVGEDGGAFAKAGGLQVETSGEYAERTVTHEGWDSTLIDSNYTFEVTGDAGARGGAIYFTRPVPVLTRIMRQIEIRVNASKIPAYKGTEGGDAYIALIFSAVAGGSTDTGQSAAFIVLLRWSAEDTLLATCRMGIESKEYTVKVTPGEDIVILLGWDNSDTPASVIAVNGVGVLKGEITKGNFIGADGTRGFLAVRAYNEEDAAGGWEFSVTAPVHIDAEMPQLPAEPEESGEDPDSGEQPGVTKGCNKGCGNNIAAADAPLAIVLLSWVVVLLRRKTKRGEK